MTVVVFEIVVVITSVMIIAVVRCAELATKTITSSTAEPPILPITTSVPVAAEQTAHSMTLPLSRMEEAPECGHPTTTV